MSKQRQTPEADEKKSKDWQPPRGITLLHFPKRPNQPFAVQWRIDGRRKTKTFATKEKRLQFAQQLAGAGKDHGLAAYRLNEGEAREWRAFRAMIGEGTDLKAVAACWEKHKVAMNRPALTVKQAVADYTKAKEAEGISAAAVSHYGPIFDRLEERLGERDVATVTAKEISDWMAEQDGSHHTRRTRFARIRALFNWLAETDQLDASPFRGMKPPKVPHSEVEILTLAQSKKLFADNATNEDGQPIDQERRETLGRLALEAFAGLRNDTAAQIVADEIQPDGLRIPAAKLKTAQPQFLDSLPANLHAWLKWSQPESWTMTKRQYAKAKESAFTRARVPHPHNCLRHGFASYHVAAFKNPSATSVILCHKSAKLLWDVYRGIANESDGKAYFETLPPELG
jgi:hypothetical protein